MIETVPNIVSTDFANLRKAEVTQLLKRVIVPILNNDIVSLGMVRNLRIVDDYVYLRLYIGSDQLELKEQVIKILSNLGWCKKPMWNSAQFPKFVQL